MKEVQWISTPMEETVAIFCISDAKTVRMAGIQDAPPKVIASLYSHTES